MQKKDRRIYLDHAATTPVDPAAAKAMAPYWSETFGNPGSLHSCGQQASAAVFEARRKIAKELNCRYGEIIFTGSATEANNLALRGAVKYAQQHAGLQGKPRIVISAIEHESVMEVAEDLARGGVDAVKAPVSEDGIIDLEELKKLIDDSTVLVSVMHVNNETGTVQPVREIAALIAAARLARKSPWPLFHTDAVQAFNYLPCDVEDLNVDFLTLSGQKIYGPKGIGLLYVRNADRKPAARLAPLLMGGGQEGGLRSGTENVPLIAGFAEAAAIAGRLRNKEVKRLKALQSYCIRKIAKEWAGAAVNGSLDCRVPNNINVCIPGIRAQETLIRLDRQGIAISSGSACSARALRPSAVLQAMGCDAERALESLRISMGRSTVKKHIDKLLAALKNIK